MAVQRKTILTVPVPWFQDSNTLAKTPIHVCYDLVTECLWQLYAKVCCRDHTMQQISIEQFIVGGGFTEAASV